MQCTHKLSRTAIKRKLYVQNIIQATDKDSKHINI